MHINVSIALFPKRKPVKTTKYYHNAFNATIRRPIVGIKVGIKLNKYACFLNVLKLEKTAL